MTKRVICFLLFSLKVFAQTENIKNSSGTLSKLDEKSKPVVEEKSSKLSHPLEIPPPLTKGTSAELMKPLMEVPKTLDTAVGNFNINDGSCNLNYSYSNEILDPLEERQTRYEILLTSVPIPAKKFNEFDGLLSISGSEQCWFYAEIESKTSLNPLKIFIPGKEPVTYSGPSQPFLRRNIETRDSVIGGTIVFKDPLEIGPLKITGQVSFRSHFRTLGKAIGTIIKRSKYVQNGAQGTEEVYKKLLEEIRKVPERTVASIPEVPKDTHIDPLNPGPVTEDPTWTPEKEGASQNSDPTETLRLPTTINLKHAFLNSKEQKVALVIEGIYTPEQVASGMTIIKTDISKNKGQLVYGLALMSQKDGKWIKDRIRWTNEIPNWAKGQEKNEAK
jgi:hypothetical protein